MRRSILFVFLPVLLSVSSAHAADGDITVVSALDFAFKDMTLDPGGGTKFNTTLTTLNPGVAIAYGHIYTNISFDKSIDSASATQVDNGSPSMLTMSRSDVVLTMGYRALDSVSLFAGWLSGEIGAYIAGERNTGGGNFAFFAQDVSYTEKGPFAGVALSHSFADKGSVSLTVAYAKLTGELTQTRYIGGLSPGVTHDVTAGDVNGLSYGLVWTGPLNGSMNYRLGAKSTRYEGDATGSQPGITEHYTSFFFGLTNTF